MRYRALISVRDSYRCELLNTRHSLYSYRISTATLEESQHNFRITERNFEKKDSEAADTCYFYAVTCNFCSLYFFFVLPTSSNYDTDKDIEVKDIAPTAITLGLRLGEIFKQRVEHVPKIADSTVLRLKTKLKLKQKQVETKTDRGVFKECFCTSFTCGA